MCVDKNNDGDGSTVWTANVDVTMKVNGSGGSVELDVRAPGDVPPLDEAQDMPPMPSYEGPEPRLKSYSKEEKWDNPIFRFFMIVVSLALIYFTLRFINHWGEVTGQWNKAAGKSGKSTTIYWIGCAVFFLAEITLIVSFVPAKNIRPIDFNLKLLDSWERNFSNASMTMTAGQARGLYEKRAELLRDRFAWELDKKFLYFAFALLVVAFFGAGPGVLLGK